MPVAELRRNALAAIVASVAVVCAYLAVSYGIQWAVSQASASEGVAATASSVVLIPVFVFLRRRLQADDDWPRDKRNGVEPRSLALAIAVGVGLAVSSCAFVGSGADAPAIDIWAVAGFGLAVPLVEELLFRGVILEGLQPALPKAAALALSSVLFAVGHGDLAHIAFALVAGLAFGLVYLACRSVLMAVAAHAAANLSSLALMWAFPAVAATTAGTVVAVAIIIACMVLLARKAFYGK